MIYILYMWLAFLCSNPNHTASDNCNGNYEHSGSVTTNGDTGGETGGTPKPPTPPPPPPPGGEDEG